MSSFNKTGVVIGTMGSTDFTYVLIDENGTDLSDESGNILVDGISIDNIDSSPHGFIEGFSMMSIYNSGTITCNEFIEW